MASFARTDTSVVGRWWWTVDRWILLSLGLLFAVGLVLTLAASPAVATRLDIGEFHFVKRQIVFLALTLTVIFAASLLTPVGVRRLAAIGFVASLFLAALTLLIGPEVKGAQRWLYFGGLTLQPTEFVKPTFAVVAAWMFAEGRRSDGFPGVWIAAALFAIVFTILLLQPDVGMALVVTAVWCVQFFIAGLSAFWIGLLGIGGLLAGLATYTYFPHVADRVDRFLDPAAENYQIDRAIEAFTHGGLLGRGPGQGEVKSVLPDAHTDFIFAVAGEEFGLLACLLIVGLFAFVVLRSLSRLMGESSLFVMLAAGGLITQFGLQAIINMGVNLKLMPTKGMTLPFISYGGSSMLALALGMGMLLALTRRRPTAEALE